MYQKQSLYFKYPVVYPTTIDTELGEKMKVAILKDFDSWNSGYDAWSAWTDEFYTEDVKYDHRGEVYDFAKTIYIAAPLACIIKV